MKLEHWMQLLFGVVILGAIGFLSNNQYDIKGILSGVATKLEATDNRISRIANTLPDIKVRVASEEVNNPMTGFVIASVQKKMSDQKLVTRVVLYDAIKRTMDSFYLESEVDKIDHTAYLLSGKIKREDPFAISFSDLARYSIDIKEPVTIPPTIDTDTSFVLRDTDIEPIRYFLTSISMEGQIVVGRKFVIDKGSRRIDSWDALTGVLGNFSFDQNLTFAYESGDNGIISQ